MRSLSDILIDENVNPSDPIKSEGFKLEDLEKTSSYLTALAAPDSETETVLRSAIIDDFMKAGEVIFTKKTEISPVNSAKASELKKLAEKFYGERN